MKILIVDDQVSVVNGLENGIHWASLGISKVWKAYNALDAKKIIGQENIDILLSDIEMPEESGLNLCRWIRENGYDIECIILTAYADFNFAKEAVKLGVYDYILQPVDYEEIRKLLQKVVLQINRKRKNNNWLKLGKKVYLKKQLFTNEIIRRWVQDEQVTCSNVIHELSEFDYSFTEEDQVCCLLMQVLEWGDKNRKLDDTLFCFVIENILHELMDEPKVAVICACLERGIMSCIIVGDKVQNLKHCKIKSNLSEFMDAIWKLYNCRMLCYFDDVVKFKNAAESIRYLVTIGNKYRGKEGNIYYANSLELEQSEKVSEVFETDQDKYIREVIRYIQCNIEQPLQRADIAGIVNLNEDYLSRIFKNKTGLSLKEYIINEKMTVAKNLLMSTNLPVGTIAAKVGYTNFAHFSVSYRKVMGISPLEERHSK